MALLDSEAIVHRFTNHPPATAEVGATMDTLTAKFIALATHVNDVVPEGREAALAQTHLEQAQMWAKAGIARNQSEGESQ